MECQIEILLGKKPGNEELKFWYGVNWKSHLLCVCTVLLIKESISCLFFAEKFMGLDLCFHFKKWTFLRDMRKPITYEQGI